MAIFSRLGRYTNLGLLLMRLGVGAMMVVHGFPKLAGGTAKWEKLGASMAQIGVTAYPVFWGLMAGLTEALGGLLLIIGFVFRPTCFLLLFTMVIATLSHLSKGDGISGASHAIELGFVFLGLFFVGPGRYSVDKT